MAVVAQNTRDRERHGRSRAFDATRRRIWSPGESPGNVGGCCVTGDPSGWVRRIPGMAQSFIGCDRDQVLLMAPSLRDWLPADHLAWFVISAVEGMDLAAFYGVYRLDGQGRPAHEPAMMVALLVYAYARGQLSSRRIERA